MSPEGVAPQKTSQPLEVPRDRRGRIMWNILRQNPEHLQGFIEHEASQFYQNIGDISMKLLTKHGRGDLPHAISRHYPGSMRALRAKLEVGEVSVRPNGYWTAERREQEVLEFFGRNGVVTTQKLKESGKWDLLAAIHRNGHLHDLLTKIGIKPSTNPKGYWTEKRILEEARDISLREGRLSHNYLVMTKRSSHTSAIARRYPGGWKQLKMDLGNDNTHNPSENWITNYALARQTGGNASTIRRQALKYKDSHPEWFRMYVDPAGNLREHYSPKLVTEITEALSANASAELPISPEQANERTASLTDIQQLFLNLSEADIQKVVHQYIEYAKTHPDEGLDIVEFYAREYQTA